MQAMCTPMHMIIPSTPPSPTSGPTGALYVGSMTAINDTDLLREHHISHLIQVLDIAWLPVDKGGLDCYRINIHDSTSSDLKPHLEAVCSYIDRALRSGKNVLVHCQQVSYSVFYILASELTVWSSRRAYRVAQPLLLPISFGIIICRSKPPTRSLNAVVRA